MKALLEDKLLPQLNEALPVRSPCLLDDNERGLVEPTIFDDQQADHVHRQRR